MGNQGHEPDWGWTQEVFTWVAGELLATANLCKNSLETRHKLPEARVQRLFGEKDSTKQRFMLIEMESIFNIKHLRAGSGIQMWKCDECELIKTFFLLNLE